MGISLVRGWDLAFQTVPFTLIDPEFAKEQLWLLLFEQFQHPNGQIPAYEWEFSDLIHRYTPGGLACLQHGSTQIRKSDRAFLENVFINF